MRYVNIKKRILSFLTFIFLFISPFSFAVSAETIDTVSFQITDGDVSVTLRLPEGKYEKITSLRLRLQIEQTAGKIDLKREHVNLFSTGSEVQEIFVEPIADGTPGYIIDLILSGNSDIFPSDTIELCTFKVENTGTDSQATADLTVVGSSYEIVNSTGTQKSIPIGEMSGHIILKPSVDHMETPPATPAPEPTVTPTPTEPPVPEPTVTPQPTESPVPEPTISPQPTKSPVPEPTTSPQPTKPPVPKPTAAPQPTKAPTPKPTATPTPEKNVFNPSVGTKISSSKAKGETAKVSLTWKKVNGADGYQIFWYNRSTKSYKLLKTILDPSVRSYTTKSLSYGQNHMFKIRAFSSKQGNARVYGKFGSSVKVKTGPSATSIKLLKSEKKQQAFISWKKVSGADGYQIYRSTSKTGTYKKVKTISGNKVYKQTLKGQKSRKKYYYKVRAYIIGSDGKHVYGKFTSPKALKIK